jgi:hypothetical protein
MKVIIGPYISWIGPYQLADRLAYFGASEDTCEKVGDYLAQSFVGDLLVAINKCQKRKIKIQIDNYDHWNADHTLALIILPLLKQLKNNKHGSSYVDNDDVPEHLRDSPDEVANAEQAGWVTDKHFERWDYVLDRMIWSFEYIVDDELTDEIFYKNGEFDIETYKSHNAKIDEGLVLFGKYYRGLWS